MVVIYVRQTWTSHDGQHHQALGFDMFRVQDGKDRRTLGCRLIKAIFAARVYSDATAASFLALARGTSLGTSTNIRDVFAESSS